MNKNVLKVILKATTTALSFLCAILLTAPTILNNNFMTITAFLGDKNYIMVEDENAEEEDTIYWETEYKSVAEEKAANLPEQMIQNSANGRMAKFFKESCLLNQEYIQDSKMSVSEYLKSFDKELTVVAYSRFTLRAE